MSDSASSTIPDIWQRRVTLRPMYQAFTAQAGRAVVFAQEEARGLGHGWVGTEHLLLGLVREEQGLAGRALVSLGVTADAVRARVVELLGKDDAVANGQLVFAPRVKKVFELALQESVAMRHSWVGTEHLLVGLIRDGGGVANRILEELGADERRVLETVTGLLARESGTEPA